jgi:hypothetical protein
MTNEGVVGVGAGVGADRGAETDQEKTRTKNLELETLRKGFKKEKKEKQYQ